MSIRDGFWLGQIEVTVGQWKQFNEDTDYKTDAEKRGKAWCVDEVEQKRMYVKGKNRRSLWELEQKP